MLLRSQRATSQFIWPRRKRKACSNATGHSLHEGYCWGDCQIQLGNWNVQTRQNGDIKTAQGRFDFGVGGQRTIRAADISFTPKAVSRQLTELQRWNFQGGPFTPTFVVEVGDTESSTSTFGELDGANTEKPPKCTPYKCTPSLNAPFCLVPNWDHSAKCTPSIFYTCNEFLVPLYLKSLRKCTARDKKSRASNENSLIKDLLTRKSLSSLIFL